MSSSARDQGAWTPDPRSGAARPRLARPQILPTGVERTFGAEEIIVSKTDPAGKITYANQVFQRVSGYTEADLLGAPHSLIRHPGMPRVVFQVLWETIASGREIFAFVVNLARDGAHYWVFAHVTPTFDEGNRIVSFHSSRRSPDRRGQREIERVYADLLDAERRGGGRGDLAASREALVEFLTRQGTTWHELMFSLQGSL